MIEVMNVERNTGCTKKSPGSLKPGLDRFLGFTQT